MITFEGIRWVGGYKIYSHPYLRMKAHPTLVFKGKDKYYFVNLTSLKELELRDLLRKNKPVEFIARDVWSGKTIHAIHPMNIAISIAVCDIDMVETADFLPTKFTRTRIKNFYKCSNLKTFTEQVLNAMWLSFTGEFTSFYCYNGNDDNYQSPDLDDYKVPEELKECIKKLVMKD